MPSAVDTRSFEHEAFLYGDLDAFVTHVGAYIRSGVEAGDAVLVATDTAKREALSDRLGPLDEVGFLDMASVGRNPGRIIAVWREFLADAVAAGRGARGVGEPVWPGRTPAELVECQNHEALLNLAFEGGPAWSLLCPYDVVGLPEVVVQEALRSHPYVVADAARRTSDWYVAPTVVTGHLSEPLPEPDVPFAEFAFAGDGLAELRDEALRRGRRAGVPLERLDDVALAVHELATNSVRYGGGGGFVRFWVTERAFVAEIRDAGHISDPLVGRVRPPVGAEGGRGLWLTHQLCDLVQLRTSPTGTVVRLWMNVLPAR